MRPKGAKFGDIYIYTGKCRYNAVQYNKILDTSLQELRISETASTKDTTYLALTGELWCVICEYVLLNGPRYNETALYFGVVLR